MSDHLSRANFCFYVIGNFVLGHKNALRDAHSREEETALGARMCLDTFFFKNNQRYKVQTARWHPLLCHARCYEWLISFCF